ncbi:hypothetical protein BDV19DRAFT_370618 [Aspergillus venezuelensis]
MTSVGVVIGCLGWAVKAGRCVLCLDVKALFQEDPRPHPRQDPRPRAQAASCKLQGHDQLQCRAVYSARRAGALSLRVRVRVRRGYQAASMILPLSRTTSYASSRQRR